MARRILHGVVIGKISLQNDFARRLPAPGSARHLGKKLERALGGAEVGQPQRDVGADHAHQRHAVDVVSLGDHLRADQQIEFAFVQGSSRRARSLRLPRTVSRSSRPMRAVGNMPCRSSSSFSEPVPRK